MAQARSFQSAAPLRDAHRERARNLRTGLTLVAILLTLFVGSIAYVMLYPTLK